MFKKIESDEKTNYGTFYFIHILFLVTKIRKNIQLCCEENHVVLLLIREESKRYYFLIKGFNTFMHDHTLHRGRKHFCRYCLSTFGTEEILKRHIKDCFKLNGK